MVLAPGDLAWRRSFTLLTHVAKLLKSTWGGHINMAISYSVEAIIPLLGDDRKAELSRGGATARRAWERAGCWIPRSDVSSEGHSPSIGNRTAPTDSFCRRGQKERQVGTSLRAWNRTRGQIALNPRRVLPVEPHRNNPPHQRQDPSKPFRSGDHADPRGGGSTIPGQNGGGPVRKIALAVSVGGGYPCGRFYRQPS